MNEQRLCAYLNLIQAILNCANGQEGQVLAANQDLIDSRFINILKQVARQMAIKGAKNTAVYLSDLATQISRNLAQEADVIKPDFEQELQIKYPGDGEQFQEVKHCEELLYALNNHQNSCQTLATATLNETPENHQLTNEPVETAINTITDTLITLPPLSTNDLNLQQVAEIPAPSPDVIPSIHHLTEVLQEISQSLNNLEKIWNASWQSSNPLWYMDVLERAQSANWLLTSEEIEKLIGVKPKCAVGKDSFQRGCWIFTKSGKMGLQTAWRISKYTNPTNSVRHNS
ncbi:MULTISPECIES: hypothetical protein [unclassified Calothrix]|uniref:hypothetical protein n=1 Tax=unclassified Calothrix TaxID=2619626 RepID=UPI0018F0120A|nr:MULTISPECIES: hypothetical protein [unclassified Calothrix]